MLELTDYTECDYDGDTFTVMKCETPPKPITEVHVGSSIINYIDMWFFVYEGLNVNVSWEAIAQTILRDKYNGEKFEVCHAESIDECREKWRSLGKASQKEDKDSKCRRMTQEESDKFEKDIKNRGYSGTPIILRGEVTHKNGY